MQEQAKQDPNYQQQPYQQPYQQQPQYQQQQFQPQQQVAYVMPMNPVMIGQQQEQMPPEFQQIIYPFSSLRRRLNCWMYVLLVFSVLSFGNFRYAGGDYWYLGIIWSLLGVCDNLSWLVGIVYGRKACNDYFLDELTKMVQCIKLSIGFSTATLLFVIILAAVDGHVILWIWAAFTALFYIVFFLVRTNYFIKPGNFLIEKFQELSKQYPQNLALKVRNSVGVDYGA